MGLCLVCVLSVAVWAQTGPSIDDLLRRTNEQSKQNEPKTREYVYRERIVTDEFNEKGESSNRHTETWEAIGLEGSEYRKLIQRDDMPLSTKEQKKEDERLRKEMEKRRKEKTLGIKNPLQRTYSFGYSRGDGRFFDFRYMGEELTGGRPAYVFEGTSKAHQRPTNNHEKQLLLSRVKLWMTKKTLSCRASKLKYYRKVRTCAPVHAWPSRNNAWKTAHGCSENCAAVLL